MAATSIAIGLVGSASAQLTQTILSGPAGSGQFGKRVEFLPSGDFLVTDPLYDAGAVADVGAVYLYSGSSLSLIATLTGGSAGDQVGLDGSDPGVRVLPSGNYVVRAPNWDQPAPLLADVGAVTWCSGATGCSGVVSGANSAVGSTASDFVGLIVRVLTNGNYVLASSAWDNGATTNAGAVRLCSGTTGCTGPHAIGNSLVGSRASDSVGSITPLPNGNYVVSAINWDNPSPALQTNTGAAAFCNGTTGCAGALSSANALVGSTTNDNVGEQIGVLSDGSYVVGSSLWNNGGLVDVGASTWCSGTTGCTPGPVTAGASLTGATVGDQVSGSLAATALPGGAYAVYTQSFDRPGGTADVGAVTYCQAGGTGCTGATATTANSLVGNRLGDLFGAGVIPVGSGAFAVRLIQWDDPVSLAGNVGAVTFCDSVTHCQGAAPTAANSLVGSALVDNVGSNVAALGNGNYVVASPGWNNGATTDVGAVTFCSGATGCQGTITPANSFIGSSASDGIGNVFAVLSNGNYVAGSQAFRSGAVAGAGAVRLCSGTTGCFGTPSAANSLVGTLASDFAGISGVAVLPNGNYVVRSSRLDDGATTDVGAATWCSGTSGCSGPITLANSLFGGTTGDRVGESGVAVFSDGTYAVQSNLFDAAGPVADAGAITFGDGVSPLAGRVGTTNSVIGTVTNDFTSLAYDPVRKRYLVGRGGSNKIAIVEVPEPALLPGLAAGLALIGLVSRRRGCAKQR